MSARLSFGQSARPASILVVDDEPDVADLFRQRFRRETRQGTCVMHFAASGAEALDRLSGEIRPGRGPLGHQQPWEWTDCNCWPRSSNGFQSSGHDGDRLWRRRPKTPRPRTRRFRVHPEASRFRSVEGAFTPIARRNGLVVGHAVSPAANRRPDRKSSRCSEFRYWEALCTTIGVIIRKP
jgi:hypothetical protein